MPKNTTKAKTITKTRTKIDYHASSAATIKTRTTIDYYASRAAGVPGAGAETSMPSLLFFSISYKGRKAGFFTQQVSSL